MYTLLLTELLSIENGVKCSLERFREEHFSTKYCQLLELVVMRDGENCIYLTEVREYNLW